jgi:hypothetical protein
MLDPLSSMTSPEINLQLIESFEQGLDPRHPESSKVPARVLGFGEISTVLQIGSDSALAYKRMPMFKNAAEVEPYETLYHAYLESLAAAGIEVVPGAFAALPEQDGRVVAYIAQEALPSGTIAHQAIQALPPDEVQRLFLAVLAETSKVFDFNDRQDGRLALGFDAQISNWAVAGYQPGQDHLPEPILLRYFDTSTPLLRRDGREQLDPELFLRSAPSFLVWIIRLFLLDEVMNRYYDRRQVIVDIIANFYKEGLPELIPDLVAVANDFLVKASDPAGAAFEPLTAAEIAAYYKDDARTWRIYLAFRKIDRSLHRLLGREYPYILPDKVKR